MVEFLLALCMVLSRCLFFVVPFVFDFVSSCSSSFDTFLSSAGVEVGSDLYISNKTVTHQQTSVHNTKMKQYNRNTSNRNQWQATGQASSTPYRQATPRRIAYGAVYLSIVDLLVAVAHDCSVCLVCSLVWIMLLYKYTSSRDVWMSCDGVQYWTTTSVNKTSD